MSLGPQCCENPPPMSNSGGYGDGVGLGSVIEIGGLKSYVTGSSNPNNVAIILISDVYGYEAPNLRNIADKLAAAGYYVVVPDFFNGNPFVANNPDKFLVEVFLGQWLISHLPDTGVEGAKRVIADLRSKGSSAIGVAGFCWGGRVALELNKSEYIQAAIMLHPSMVTVDDFKGIKAPIALLGAEFDRICPPALVKQFDEVRASTKPKVDGYAKVFKGVRHGWTVRYKADDERSVLAAEEAYQDVLHWFQKHFKDVGSSKL